ncbi:MAG: C39 family peptidase [Verrucomicrobiota bacterium]
MNTRITHLTLLIAVTLTATPVLGVPNSFFGNGIIVIPAHPRFNSNLTREVLSAKHWDQNQFPGPWEKETALADFEVKRMSANPTLFGAVPDSVRAYSENNELHEITITFLDAGSFFGFKAGGEKSHSDRLAGADRRSEFNQLYRRLTENLRMRLEQGCGPGKQNIAGRSDLLRQVYTDYQWENFTLRLATRDQHSVSLHIFRDQSAPRSFIDPDWAPLSPSERTNRLKKNVRHSDQGDLYLENIPMFQQGHTPFCGIHSLAMVGHYYGLRIKTADLAAGAEFRNTGSARGSNMLNLYHAAAKEIDMKVSVSSRFDPRRAERALEAGLPIIVWRRVSEEREKAHQTQSLAALPPPNSTQKKSWPARDKKGSPSHASVITGINLERNEIIFTEPWGDHARDRRMRFEEMEATAYAAFYFKW